MNILIPNSWLKEYLDTNADPQEFATTMSLASVSIEKIENIGNDFVYDIEVTTNRPDLMSIEGIAKEASAVLPQAGFKAKLKTQNKSKEYKTVSKSPFITITNDSELVNRITAAVLEVTIKPSPKIISDRLEKTGIRSINNVVDTTNYIMRELGHPVHAFDYDRLTENTLIIRKSKKGEKVTTLDGKEYDLLGNDIVADDGKGDIVDLLGIMGLSNSSVTDNTKRVLLFIDNNNPHLLRKTSMNLGIRTDAAILNEKGVDPEKMLPTLYRGIALLTDIANAKVVSDVIDIYDNKPSRKKISVSFEKIRDIIGVDISSQTINDILTALGFEVSKTQDGITVLVPTARSNDMEIAEDIIEEIARIYGYNKIPSILPPILSEEYYHQDKNEFYWISKIKNAFKFWGFYETYTYSMVNEELFDGPVEKAVKIKNPLDIDHVYMRNSLANSLIAVANNNKSRSSIKLFELSNVYIGQKLGLPREELHLAVIIRKENASFYEGKGILEQILSLLGISEYQFVKKNDGIEGAFLFIGDEKIGMIEVDSEEVIFEINFSFLIHHTSSKKQYIEPPKFPPIIEDVRIETNPKITYEQICKAVKQTNMLIRDVALLDTYGTKKTFRITYLNAKGNLTNDDITPIRNAIYKMLKHKFSAVIG